MSHGNIFVCLGTLAIINKNVVYHDFGSCGISFTSGRAGEKGSFMWTLCDQD